MLLYTLSIHSFGNVYLAFDQSLIPFMIGVFDNLEIYIYTQQHNFKEEANYKIGIDKK